MSEIKIVPVKGLGGFLEFCKVQRLIYTGMKGFAAQLDAERWALYGSKLNPHFKSVDWQAWLAYNGWQNRRPQSSRKSTKSACRSAPRRHNSAVLIRLRTIPYSPALLEAAETWLRDRGAGMVHGPFSPYIWGEVGLLVNGYTAVPMIFMPGTPPICRRCSNATAIRKPAT